MFRGFWTWNPVASGVDRAFDEPHMYRNNGWFFDEEVWRKTFSAMSELGFNALVLANSHPFPFMVDLSEYPQARVIDDTELARYQEMYHRVFHVALDHGIQPYVLFFSIYYPKPLLDHLGISARDAWQATDFGIEYTNYCVRQLLRTYPELAGIVGDSSENIVYEKRELFLQQAVLDAVDDERPDIALYLRGYWSDPVKMTRELKRRNGLGIKWSMKYTSEHLVHTDPDPAFMKWVENAGAESVAGEFWISNFEPWSCFSFRTVRGIVSNLEKMGCAGFSVHPLSMYEWPFTSDTCFEYQWERDRKYYSIWGGKKTDDSMPAFEAASRIMELLGLYIAGDKENQWHPQFCSVRDYNRTWPHLLTLEDMLNFDDQKVFRMGKGWWQDVTGQQVVHFAEHLQSGTPAGAYGPEEFIQELEELSSKAVITSEADIHSQDPALCSASCDAYCMGKLGKFYAERSKAAIAHGRGNDDAAVKHLAAALDAYRRIVETDTSHRGAFRVLTARCAIIGDWADILQALEAEYADALKGEFKRGTNNYLVHKAEGSW